jgi:hypothetical protein
MNMSKVSIQEHAWIVVNTFFNISIIEIFYRAILHEKEFGQAYCKDLFKRIPKKFTCFSKVYSMFYGFLKFIRISGNLNLENTFR